MEDSLLSAATLGSIGLLEREGQIALAASAAHAAAGGTGSLVVFEGAAGTGRTRLLGAVADLGEEAGLDPVRIQGRWSETDQPFALIGPLLTGAEIVDRPPGAPAAMIKSAVGSPAIEETEPALSDALLDVLSERAAKHPLMVLIDDADLADAASLRFLAYASQRLARLPVALVLATRPAIVAREHALLEEVTRHPGASRAACPPLSRAATGDWVRDALGADADDRFCAACFEATGGNPKLLAGVLGSLAEDGIAPRSENAEVVEGLAPSAIAEWVEQGLRKLGPQALALARAVAVAGENAELRHCAELAELTHSEAAKAVDRLIAEELLTLGDRLAFVHPVVGRALYAAHAPAGRASAHLRLARRLAAERAGAEDIGRHLMFAPRMGQRWVPDSLAVAASAALVRGAPHSAIAYLNRALAEPATVESRPRLVLALGRAEAVAGEPGAVEHLREAAAMIEDPHRRALVSLDIGRTLYAQGRLEDAAAAFQRGALDATSRDPALELKLLTSRALVARAAGLDHPDVELPDPTSAQAEADDSSAGRVLLAHLAFERSVSGGARDEVIADAHRALAGGTLLRDEGPDGLAFHFAALALLNAEDIQAAEVAFDMAASDAVERGSRLGETTARYFRAWALARRGMLTAAAAEAHRALEGVERGWNLAPRNVRAILGYTLTSQGDYEGARAQFAAAADGDEGSDAPLPLLQMLRGRFHLATGRPREALADFRECEARLARSHVVNPACGAWRSGIALACRQLGEGGPALGLLEEELVLARRFAAPGPIARALSSKAALFEGADRVALLEEAADHARRSEWVLDRARILVALGTELRHHRKRKAARDPLREGLEAAERCGARSLAARARSELLASGMRPRRTALKGVGSLTQREHEIARLISQGRSNREVAERLFVTVKTVEWHLRNVFAKLEVGSRRELPGALAGEARSPDGGA